MKKLRLLCIPPYEGMYQLMVNIAARRSDVELIIHMGNLDDGVKAVDENRFNQIDAVISRGGTAETIRKKFDLPAYDIIPSVYDVLRAIRLAQGTAEPFAIAGFPSLTTPAAMLEEILQFNFPIHTIHSSEECLELMKKLKSEGIHVIVGDTIAVSHARACNMNALLIVSGMESIEAAIDTAIRTHSYYEKINQNARLLTGILKEAGHDTLVYSASGEIVFSTWKDYPQKIYDLCRKRFSTVIAQGSIKNICQENKIVYSIHGKCLNLDGESFCVYEITRQPESSSFDKYKIRILSRGDDLPDTHPLEYYLGVSMKTRDLLESCRRYAELSTPVLLLGERGTGKDRFAHYIYSLSRRRNSSFLMIDCGLLGDRGWHFLLTSDNSPLTDTGLSLYFMRLNAATKEQQDNFMYYLKGSNLALLNRLYFSCSTSSGFDPRSDLFLYLLETLHCLRLVLPSLQERTDDIPALASLYINAINVQHGTRVIGFSPDAMLLLQGHTWLRNVDQLLLTVRHLVLHAKSSYISTEQVKDYFRQEGGGKPAESVHPSWKGTLEEITRRAVLQAYREENMNQTKAAQRLGISRSTLWRMLKNVNKEDSD